MQFVSNDVVEYRLKEKLFSLSCESFSVIRESDGQKEFRVESVQRRGLTGGGDDGLKALYDSSGVKLFEMHEASLSLHNRMYVRHGSTGKTILTLKRKKVLPGSLSTPHTVHVWKGDTDHDHPWLELYGDLMRKDFTIKNLYDKSVAAFVSKKLINLSTILAESDTYVVRVNPGYNAALMVFIAIVIDEQYHDQ